ncbi:hypothetical protein [Teichococcus vastitatis]|uniref:Uncharacterized protein n=1 Tax=Teichococcus vastitatis TaxID=2307076 RepID=A0ABS9WA00_9PROT|nr:hypothetical protein [Pseudoroseomonas vastitatis]MCI0756043.1 hypothetical protein [Pseudoroseomonas vastitatis]
MTADARSLPIPGSLATPVHALAERLHLFLKRLRATPLRSQASEALLPEEASAHGWVDSRGRRNTEAEGGCDGGSAAFGSGFAGKVSLAGAAGGSPA